MKIWDVLKPTKANVLGTFLVLFADWLAQSINDWLGDILLESMIQEAITPELVETIKTELIPAIDMATSIEFIVMGILLIIAEIVMKIIFYYIMISIITTMLVNGKTKKKKK